MCKLGLDESGLKWQSGFGSVLRLFSHCVLWPVANPLLASFVTAAARLGRCCCCCMQLLLLPLLLLPLLLLNTLHSCSVRVLVMRGVLLIRGGLK